MHIIKPALSLDSRICVRDKALTVEAKKERKQERKMCLVFNCIEMVLKLEAQSLDAQFGSIRGKRIYFAIVVHWCYGACALTLRKKSIYIC